MLSLLVVMLLFLPLPLPLLPLPLRLMALPLPLLVLVLLSLRLLHLALLFCGWYFLSAGVSFPNGCCRCLSTLNASVTTVLLVDLLGDSPSGQRCHFPSVLECACGLYCGPHRYAGSRK